MGGVQNTVLVVDDDAACRELHTIWLADEYQVVKAADGTEALDYADQADVMLLDREMPVVDGEEVARRVREDGYDCFVVMLSGVEPDFDIVDLPIDEYLTKPVTREAVLDVVESMLEREVSQHLFQEFCSLAVRKKRLDRRKRSNELAESDEYRRLTAELEAKRAAVAEMLEEVDGERRKSLLSALTDDVSLEESVQS